MKAILAFVLCCVILLVPCQGLDLVAQHVCLSDSTNANNIRVRFSILQHQDPIFKVYGFLASTGDTTLSANRVDACVMDPTSNADTLPIEFDITVDTTATAPYQCGGDVYTVPETTVKAVRFLFRVYAYSTSMLYLEDKVFTFACRADELNGNTVSSTQLDISVNPVVVVQQPRPGVFLRLRDATSNVPLQAVTIGDEVYLSVGLNPNLDKGPDNYGTHFFVGFLGNDPITGTSASQLTIQVVPRNKVRTDVLVTSNQGEKRDSSSDGSPMVFTFTPEIMGCSNGGVVEIADKGIEIQTYDQECSVLVCNRDVDTADCYTALPVDIIGNTYYAVSMPTTSSASELMVIGTEDSTDVSVTLSPGTTLTIQLNSTVSKAAGETMTFMLNKGATFHLAVSHDTVAESLNNYKIVSTKPVSLISGNRAFAGDHLADHIPPDTVFGTSYVLIPVDLPGDARLTTYIVQAIEAGDTTVTQHLATSTVVKTVTLGTTFVTFDVESGKPCELTADKRIMVTQVVNGPTASGGFDPTMVMMPSTYQWAAKYTLVDVSNSVKVPLVFRNAASAAKFTINGNVAAVSATISVSGPTGYVFSTGLPFADYTATQTSFVFSTTDVVTTFMPMVYKAPTGSAPTDGIGYLPAGFRYAPFAFCKLIGFKNDGVDNDCDGWIDEENDDDIDNDGDGDNNEDMGGGVATDLISIVGVKPFNCKVSGLEDFSDPKFIFDLTGADGCKVSGNNPFIPASEFSFQTETNVGAGVQQKFINSGIFRVAMFIDHTKLFYMCDVDFCYSAADEKCKTICTPPAARRKRQAESNEPPRNVTTDVRITTYRENDRTSVDRKSESASGVGTSECLSVPDVQIILGFMAALALVSLLAAIFFCCLFKRNRRRKRHSHSDPRSKRYDNESTMSSRKREVFYVMR